MIENPYKKPLKIKIYPSLEDIFALWLVLMLFEPAFFCQKWKADTCWFINHGQKPVIYASKEEEIYPIFVCNTRIKFACGK